MIRFKTSFVLYVIVVSTFSLENSEGKNYKITWGMTKGRKGYTVNDSPPARAKSIKVEEIL